ncbi:class I SAM-dependent methyltransferase [Clostridium sp.]|jgi:ubiquinone/menaquinone biosynthesis C-methylase UbiE|uniref:class I SAM-dependent methyltransferase n=1 Tax=Clostridium sp. TaxID=1506 RepID=UPI002584893C|nr:class I SAM-dependent methyltransferase [Clostridium sp.]MDF2505040.1 methyltransferase family protein [Clostridium sp.]
MDYKDKDRFFSMAQTYNEMIKYVLPQYDFLQNEAIKSAPFKKDDEIVVFDLGAGSGIFLERILSNFPKAKCYWIDYSTDFMKAAKERLSAYSDRVEYITTTLQDNLESKVKVKADLIFSMSAIHHLETEEKKSLYKICFNMLKPSGWFFNCDEMKTLYKDSYINSMNFWIDYVNNVKSLIPAEKLKYYESFISTFSKWQERNVKHVDTPKVKGDDIHESFLSQIEWLKDAGFSNVDLFVKYHLWSIIGGSKH